MEEIERSAGSVEEAIESALAELGLSEQEARIEIVQEPRSGFLGLNSQPAVVRVAPLAASVEDGGDTEGQAAAAVDFLEGLFEAMGLDAEVETVLVDGVTYLDVWGGDSGEEMGILIGKHGHTLDALQELVRGHVQRMTGERCLVMVDVEDYRKRRRTQVARRAREAAQKVRRSGKPEAMEPMSSYERKVVHDTVADLGGLETSSEGEEPRRYVVIKRLGR